MWGLVMQENNLKVVGRAILVIFLILSLTECFLSGGDDSGTADDVNIAWININYSSVDLYADGIIKARIGGDAFISKDYVAHQCVGLGCWFDWYDDSYPGVDITWNNLTTGEQGAAISKYGTITDWDHWWYAHVPVVFGFNQLEVTASDPANSATASISVESIPLPPNDLWADTGDGQITLFWSPVKDITNYRIYWSDSPGTSYPYGTPIDVTVPPYVHSGLANGTTYYYVIASRFITGESEPSEEIAATAGIPPQPVNLSANLVSLDIELIWDATPTADTYTLYWSNESGVTKQNGTPIMGAVSPFLHTGLMGFPYYYVVTALNGYGESIESEEAMAFPPLPPPAPTELSATLRPDIIGYPQVVDLSWKPVPGADNYEAWRCFAGFALDPSDCDSSSYDCQGTWQRIATPTEATYPDWTVDYQEYRYLMYKYYIIALNAYGRSQSSDWAGLCVGP